MPRKVKEPPAPVTCQLRHGIIFTVTHSGRPIKSVQLCNFFAMAMKHFKSLPKPDVYEGGELVGRMGNCVCTLSRHDDSTGQFITAGQWADAAIWAYCTADTIDQMCEALPAYRTADTTGSMSDILALLPSRSLEAMQMMLRRSP
jgi:hypothetical protein